jgi:hypothetical protein
MVQGRHSYGVVKVKKYRELKGQGKTLQEAFKHNTRSDPNYTPKNINPELTYLNKDLIPLPLTPVLDKFDKPVLDEDGNQKMRQVSYEEMFAREIEKRKDTIPKLRKNGVKGIECVIKYTQDINGDPEKWAADSLEFIKRHFGEENVKHCVLHMDETHEIEYSEDGTKKEVTLGPHIHAYIIPIDKKGHLNCKSFIDGPADLAKLQTDYYEEVGKDYGLERGVPYAKRAVGFEDIHAFKQATIGRAKIEIKELEPTLMELNEDGSIKPEYAQRVIKDAQDFHYQQEQIKQDFVREYLVREAGFRGNNIEQKKEIKQLKASIEKMEKDKDNAINEALEMLKPFFGEWLIEYMKRNNYDINKIKKQLNAMTDLEYALNNIADENREQVKQICNEYIQFGRKVRHEQEHSIEELKKKIEEI